MRLPTAFGDPNEMGWQSRQEFARFGMLVLLLEVKRLGDKEIYPGFSMAFTVELKDDGILFPNPRVAFRRISEIRRGNWGERRIPQRPKGFECAQDVRGLQLNDEV